MWHAVDTINCVVVVLCDAIIRHYRDEYVGSPAYLEDWKEIEWGFRDRWSISYTIWALDSKHITIRYHRKSGSKYFNYKVSHSLVLFAMVDAEYKFIWYDITVAGSSSDSQIFNYSDHR